MFSSRSLLRIVDKGRQSEQQSSVWSNFTISVIKKKVPRAPSHSGVGFGLKEILVTTPSPCRVERHNIEKKKTAAARNSWPFATRLPVFSPKVHTSQGNERNFRAVTWLAHDSACPGILHFSQSQPASVDLRVAKTEGQSAFPQNVLCTCEGKRGYGF